MADDLAIDLALIPANNRKRRGLVNRTLWETLRSSIFQGKNDLCKVEKILKCSLYSIPSPSVKIQIMGGKECLRCISQNIAGHC